MLCIIMFMHEACYRFQQEKTPLYCGLKHHHYNFINKMGDIISTSTGTCIIINLLINNNNNNNNNFIRESS